MPPLLRYMVMDLCPRGPIMETEKMPCEPLAPADARRWFVDAAIGLDYLHFQGTLIAVDCHG